MASLVRKEGQSKQHQCTQAVPTQGSEGSSAEREDSQPKEAYPWGSAVSVMVAPQKPPAGETWEEGERREGLAEEEAGRRTGELPHFCIILSICLRFSDVLSIS